jgi:small subunit ribosomal protein S8
MPTTDPVADLLTCLRNAALAGHDHVLVPASRLRLELVKLLKSEGFIQKYDLVDYKNQGRLRVTLKYGADRQSAITGLRRLSRPGLRVYARWQKIPRVRAGLGTTLVSTSKGLLSDREARRRRLGGELLCQVW